MKACASIDSAGREILKYKGKSTDRVAYYLAMGIGALSILGAEGLGGVCGIILFVVAGLAGIYMLHASCERCGSGIFINVETSWWPLGLKSIFVPRRCPKCSLERW
jgi:hypothetical protein